MATLFSLGFMILVNNSSKENEDVEVKHTIVVSTKLKNNNRRGLQNSRDDNPDPAMHRSGLFLNRKKEDSGEVPVIKGYKALETTQILTPDTRLKSPINAVNAPVWHNTPDEYDIYPNQAINPMQFKPSNFYNNINWWSQDDAMSINNFIRRNYATSFPNTRSVFHRDLTEDGVSDFYCKKCREMGGGHGTRGCVQQSRNPWHNVNTTPRVKIDGKLAKLNYRVIIPFDMP
ncbi:unnamed protein product, partial [Iphiclides podalirius]